MPLPLLAGIPLLDAAVTIGGLIIPPAFDFIKKKFIKEENDTPERTMGTLATTKPEVLADYVNALGSYLKAQVDFFNRDVIGQCSQWVVNLRAAIRPTTVAVGVIALILNAFDGGQIPFTSYTFHFNLPEGIRLFFEGNCSSWFGSRLSK